MDHIRTVFLYAVTFACPGLGAYTPPAIPYAPAAGEAGSTAIAHDDERIQGWAVSVESVQFGTDLEDSLQWKDPAKALGPAEATNPSVLVLGRGGSAVLEFLPTIGDGEGDDFVVFENGFSDTFLELAFVEVSSDGEHFVRFPNYSLTPEPVGSWGQVSATFVHGFAGKYRAGFGTPFDLAVLQEAYAAALAGEGGFSEAFRAQLLENFPHLETGAVRYVRIIDIVGDGTSADSEGFAIYDPYPTFITSGFDLDAIGVINAGSLPQESFSDWSGRHGLPELREADTDKDGWAQYLEYLMGSDPKDGTSVPGVRQWLSDGNTYRLEFAASRSAEAVPVLEYSRDGRFWQRLEPVQTEAGALFVRMSVSLDINGPGKAIFLRFTAP